MLIDDNRGGKGNLPPGSSTNKRSIRWSMKANLVGTVAMYQETMTFEESSAPLPGRSIF